MAVPVIWTVRSPSDYGTTSIGCYGFSRDSWAGDRIDVHLIDHVMENMRQEGWKDISQQEAVKLDKIWCVDVSGSWVEMENFQKNRKHLSDSPEST